jgi:hypothetical protein
MEAYIALYTYDCLLIQTTVSRKSSTLYQNFGFMFTQGIRTHVLQTWS